jgi:hypothetical protein
MLAEPFDGGAGVRVWLPLAGQNEVPDEYRHACQLMRLSLAALLAAVGVVVLGAVEALDAEGLVRVADAPHVAFNVAMLP